MPHDAALADRVRELIAAEPGVSEKRMFGGLAFLLDGRMSVAVSSRGGLLVRVDPEEQPSLLTRPHVSPFVMRERALRGWLRVDTDGLESDGDLAFWVERGVDHAQSLHAGDRPVR